MTAQGYTIRNGLWVAPQRDSLGPVVTRVVHLGGLTLSANYDVVTPTVRYSGPDAVRYEDLFVPGDTIREVMAKVPVGKILTLPEGVFEFSNFVDGNQIGLTVKTGTKGIAGSGPNTIIRMVPFTSTRASSVPAQGTNPAETAPTNQLYLLKTLDGTNQIFQQFTLEGTNQGHLYNGFMVMQSTGVTLQDLWVSGIPGDNHAPPGETFAINMFRGSSSTILRIDVTGIRKSDGVNVGSSPFGYNNHAFSTITDSYFHDNWCSTWAAWQSHDITTYNIRSHRNGSDGGAHSGHGLNHERCYNIVHHDPDIIINYAGGNRGYHMSMNNDLADGLLTVYGPKYDDDPRVPKVGGVQRLVIMSFATYFGVSQKTVTAPVVRNSAGTANFTPAYAWAH